MSDLDLEATWISVFLDVGVIRTELDEAARKAGLRWYGDGKFDELQDSAPHASALRAVAMQYVSQPQSWVRLMSVLANSVMFASNEKELRTNLLKLVAFATAWIEDIERRGKPGYKDGNG